MARFLTNVFFDVGKIPTNKIFECISGRSKTKYNLLSQSYSKGYAEKLVPVDIAYSSYECTNIDRILKRNYPVFIMHGLLGSKNNWNGLSKSVHSRTNLKVVSIDARNHGDSPHTDVFNYDCLVEDIRHLMSELGFEKINALGHSLGGRTMMLLALKYPRLVNSLIVVDISPVRTSSAIMDLRMIFEAMLSCKFVHNIPLSKARQVVDEQLKNNVPDMYLRQFLLTNLIESEPGRYKWRVNLKSLVNNFPSIINFKPPTTTFKGPVLFIGGRNSTFLRPEDHEGILNYFPKAQFEYVEGAGHWVHSEKPTEFLNLTCNFLIDV